MKLNMMWIVLCNIGMVNAELLIMPVTLSAITKLAPRKFTSSLIGVYYVTFSIGSIFAGLFANFTSSEDTMNFLAFLTCLRPFA